jgi:hypothetical protein
VRNRSEFQIFSKLSGNSGLIIGIDLSGGMLDQAKRKTEKKGGTNIDLELDNATKIDQNWLAEYSGRKGQIKIDTIFCDLGLQDYPNGGM